MPSWHTCLTCLTCLTCVSALYVHVSYVALFSMCLQFFAWLTCPHFFRCITCLTCLHFFTCLYFIYMLTQLTHINKVTYNCSFLLLLNSVICQRSLSFFTSIKLVSYSAWFFFLFLKQKILLTFNAEESTRPFEGLEHICNEKFREC